MFGPSKLDYRRLPIWGQTSLSTCRTHSLGIKSLILFILTLDLFLAFHNGNSYKSWCSLTHTQRFRLSVASSHPSCHDPTNWSMHLHNAQNCLVKTHNEDSMAASLNCHDDRTYYPDVGASLLALFLYSTEEIT